ncbi:MAG: antitoxin [Candidatus Aquiluna sp. XM-24bin5]|nr:MAG: antitoxin [Candidatus Aquiluna sp. XM-24bin5]
MQHPLSAKLLAEFLGTALIVSGVVGAGFMTATLQSGYPLGLTMIAATVAAILFVAISIFGPISGAHFNPVVTLGFLVRKAIASGEAGAYIAAQVLGAISGAVTANLMFGSAWLEVSKLERFSLPTFLGEVVATWGLVLLILLLVHFEKANLVAASVAAWIFAGHIFTSSTSFANPAVTLGRIFTEAPSGIAPDSALWFALAQLIGMAIALITFAPLTKKVGS